MNVQVTFKIIIVCTLIVTVLPFENRYTKEANANYREVDKPFRMAKLNLIWQKSKHKLTEKKLQSLYLDLQFQDKEEIKLKRLIADGMDKDGMKEADVRKKLKGILTSYGIMDFFDDSMLPEKPSGHSKTDNHVNKALFKDKKLNQLWEKAEKSGFNEKELKTLKEEFIHHQDKIDEYYTLLESMGKEDSKNAMLNDIDHMNLLEESDQPLSKDRPNHSANKLQNTYRGIKDGYDVLHKKAVSGPSSLEFAEPRVEALWKMALKADFAPDELESLRNELKHYERRIEKLQHLQSEFIVKSDHAGGDKEHLHNEKDLHSLFQDKLKRQERHIEKLHNDLETRIMNRHTEL